MTPLYRIKDWDRHFETHKTRIVADLHWIRMPNKMDGDGYTLLVSHKNGAAHLGAWWAMVQIASKCQPRGTLIRADGSPHDPESLSRISRIPAKVFKEAIPRLASQQLGWLEEDGGIAPSRGVQAPSRGVDRTTEENRGEESREEKTLPSGERTRAREGKKPESIEAVRSFWSEAPLKGLPEAFWDHFETNGWRTRQGPVKDWHAAARNWSRREGTFGGGRSGKTGPEINPDVRVGRAEYVQTPEEADGYRVLVACHRIVGNDKNRASRLWVEWRDAGKPPFEEWIAARSPEQATG